MGSDRRGDWDGSVGHHRSGSYGAPPVRMALTSAPTHGLVVEVGALSESDPPRRPRRRRSA